MLFGEEPISVIRQCLESPDDQGSTPEQVIDPFLGYSVKLPRLLVRISRFGMIRHHRVANRA